MSKVLEKLSMRIMRAPYIFAFRGMDWGERVMAKLLICNDLHNPISIYVPLLENTQRCEFVGQEFLDGHTASRPDLKILCSNGTIYFENKLESPLSLDQMQRHASFTCRDPTCRLIFVSNIYHEMPVCDHCLGISTRSEPITICG